MAHVANIPVVRTALELDGWLAWNEETWKLTPLRVRYGGSSPDQPRLEGVLYTDRRGRVRMPPRNPYLPFRFLPTLTTRIERVSRQWLELGAELAEDLASRGVIGTLVLPPGLIDARPFQWLGFEVSILYTYVIDLPV